VCAELRREVFGCAGDCAEAFEPDEGGRGDVSSIGEIGGVGEGGGMAG